MKKKLLLMTAAAFMAFGAIGYAGSHFLFSTPVIAKAESRYSTGTIPTSGWSASGGNVTMNRISWAYSSCTYMGASNGKLQIGSKNNPQITDWTIRTNIANFGESIKISSVSINAYTTATSATYSIGVGSESLSGDLTTSAASYTLNNISVTAGDIVVSLKGSSSSKAMYLGSISVVYEAVASGDGGKSALTEAFESESNKTLASLAFNYHYSGDSDVVNWSTTKLTHPTTGSSWSTWTNEDSESGVVYSGTTFNDLDKNEADYLQFRSDSSNTGILAANESKKLSKLTINWNPKTTSGRSIDIYGMDDAYSGASDLFNSETQGTKIGTFTYNGSNVESTLSFESLSQYNYIGIRSKSGAVYVDSLEFVWGTISYSEISNMSLLFKSDFSYSSYVFNKNDYLTGMFIFKDSNVSDSYSFISSHSAPALNDETKIINSVNASKSNTYLFQLNNVSLAKADYDVKYTAVSYVKIGSEYYYNVKKTVSLKTMVDTYKASDNSTTVGLVEAIENQVNG